MAMRQGRENQIDVREVSLEPVDGRIRVSSREMRMDGGDRLPGLAVAVQLHGRERGMRRYQPQQLTANIARGSKDRRPNHGGAPIFDVAFICKRCVYLCTWLIQKRGVS